jgi:magnesium chelatase family protein
MLARVYAAAVCGVDAFEVEIEVNAGSGNVTIVVVGLPDAAVRESKDRVTAAIANSGFRWPRGRTTVNLAPADLRKEGPGFDLPIALGMIAAAGQIGDLQRPGRRLDPDALRESCVVGELALTGAVRPVKGALAIAAEARRRGRRRVIVPGQNAMEAAAVEGIKVIGVGSLRETCEYLSGDIEIEPCRCDLDGLLECGRIDDLDFGDVRGQNHARRAIEVAISGAHNLLMLGPPGSGKSMLARRIPTVMPPLSLAEAIETTKIHSVAGLLNGRRPLVAIRPFRSPHHTISDAGLLGGSANPNPGEVSLAHNGVLFLDEFPEFKRSTLEVLRQPIEDGRVTISRAAGSVTFPCAFLLVCAMNPCPCGYLGHARRECRCTPRQVQEYHKRISGPLLDRIDLHVEVPAIEYADMARSEPGESSEAMRLRIAEARAVQRGRFGPGATGACNARMSPRQIREHCRLDPSASELLRAAMGEMHLSARAHDRILKVARTIADLAGLASISTDHIAEAIQYRALDRKLWM